MDFSFSPIDMSMYRSYDAPVSSIGVSMREVPSQKYLQECFLYNPRTGCIYWNERPRTHFATNGAHKRANTMYAWKEAGYIVNNDGLYRKILLHKIDWLAHRLIWTWMTGNKPLDQIDHIDRNGLNNIWTNLREATSDQNHKNKGRYIKKHMHLPKGVHISGNTFQAVARYNRKKYFFGSFKTPEEARVAYLSGVKSLYGDFYIPEKGEVL